MKYNFNLLINIHYEYVADKRKTSYQELCNNSRTNKKNSALRKALENKDKIYNMGHYNLNLSKTCNISRLLKVYD